MAAGQKFRELLEVLLGHEVEFLIVGATAAVLDGAPLTTFDLDVLFEPSPENRARLLGALTAIDAGRCHPLFRPPWSPRWQGRLQGRCRGGGDR